jgi:hypothetical protein
MLGTTTQTRKFPWNNNTLIGSISWRQQHMDFRKKPILEENLRSSSTYVLEVIPGNMKYQHGSDAFLENNSRLEGFPENSSKYWDISWKQQHVLLEFPRNKGMCRKIFKEKASNVRRVSYQQNM